jgi:hypothetical protein
MTNIQKEHHLERSNNILALLFLGFTSGLLIAELNMMMKKNDQCPPDGELPQVNSAFTPFNFLVIDAEQINTFDSLDYYNVYTKIQKKFISYFNDLGSNYAFINFFCSAMASNEKINILYTKIIFNDLVIPVLYFITLLTTETNHVPTTITYYQSFDTQNNNIRYESKNIFQKKVTSVIYSYKHSEKFKTWFKLTYSLASANFLTLLTPNIVEIKENVILIDLVPFKKNFLTRLTPILQNTEHKAKLRFVQNLPNYFPLSLITVHLIKMMAQSIQGFSYIFNKKKQVCGITSSNRKSSFRTMCSSSLIAPKLIQQAKFYCIPTKLACTLQEHYDDNQTKEAIKFSFQEACCCFVFACFAPSVKKDFPKLVTYLQDFAKGSDGTQKSKYKYQFKTLIKRKI